MTKIERLTKEQEEKLPEYRDEWIGVGLSTSQDSTEEDFEKCYHLVEGLMECQLNDYIVCLSPVDMVKRGVNKNDIHSSASFGQFEAYWLGFYKFFQDEVGIELDPRLEKFVELAKHTSWVYIDPNTKIVYFSRKPVEIHMENRLLHNENGPSVLYPDGFSVWSINGHRVTEQIVMEPETLSIDQIHQESNADIQAIMIERFGWVNYLEGINAELLDSRKNDIENTVEALYNTERFGRRLVCTCPTGRVFVKGIKSTENTTTCQGAQDWLSGYQRDNRKKFNTIGRT